MGLKHVSVDFPTGSPLAMWDYSEFCFRKLIKYLRFRTLRNSPQIFINNPESSWISICKHIGGVSGSFERFPALTQIRHLQNHGHSHCIHNKRVADSDRLPRVMQRRRPCWACIDALWASAIKRLATQTNGASSHDWPERTAGFFSTSTLPSTARGRACRVCGRDWWPRVGSTSSVNFPASPSHGFWFHGLHAFVGRFRFPVLLSPPAALSSPHVFPFTVSLVLPLFPYGRHTSPRFRFVSRQGIALFLPVRLFLFFVFAFDSPLVVFIVLCLERLLQSWIYGMEAPAELPCVANIGF